MLFRVIARDDSDTTTIQRGLCTALKITFLPEPPDYYSWLYARTRKLPQSDSDETEIWNSQILMRLKSETC